MKFKRQLGIAAAIFSLIASMTVASAQQSQTSVPTIDQTTGLPHPQAAPQWKDPNWKDPAKVLPKINLDALPISEVARWLREQFTNDFDIVMPNSYRYANNVESIDPNIYTVKLQLRNVTASEVFGAMNIEFEVENTPVRWSLRMNGNRPTALLRVVPELIIPPLPQSKRMIFFVGDLMVSQQSRGFGSNQLVRIISDVWGKAYGVQPDVIQFYEPAQLVIVTGTPDQIDFVKQTIFALRQNIEMMRKERSKSAESEPKAEAPLSSDTAAPK